MLHAVAFGARAEGPEGTELDLHESFTPVSWTFTPASSLWPYFGTMTSLTDPANDSGWSAVHGLMERWAQLPPASWRMLLSAERLQPDAEPPRAPQVLDRWLVRDLVETAWTMASHLCPVKPEPWTEEARRALERLAWRLLQEHVVGIATEPVDRRLHRMLRRG
jgi:hypothetical protein